MVSRTGRTVKEVAVQPKPTVTFDIESHNHNDMEEVEKGSAILGTIEQDLVAQEMYEEHLRFRISSGFVSLFSSMLGVMLIMIGRAELETEEGKLFWLEIMGYVLLLPVILWLMFICCPTGSERRQRRQMKKNRNERLKEYSEAEIEANFVDNISLKRKQLEKEKRRKEEEIIIQADKDDKKRKEENKARANRLDYHKQKEEKWMAEQYARKQNAYLKYNQSQGR